MDKSITPELSLSITVPLGKYNRLIRENRSMKKRVFRWKKALKAIRRVCSKQLEHINTRPDLYNSEDQILMQKIETILQMSFIYKRRNGA